jgi:hypothetical protein
VEYRNSSHRHHHSPWRTFTQLVPLIHISYGRKLDFRKRSLPQETDHVLNIALGRCRVAITRGNLLATWIYGVSSTVATTLSTSTLMSFTHVPHAIVARSLMDADEIHHFSDSSRNTLIATAAVGKSIQSCSFAPTRRYKSVVDVGIIL